MLTQMQKENLKNSWGKKECPLGRMAQVRIYDTLSLWQCYLLAMNPSDEDEILCILSAHPLLTPGVANWRLSEIGSLYNQNGERVQVDVEYRPRQANIIFKELTVGNYGFRRS
jgi:hypothetical protein